MRLPSARLLLRRLTADQSMRIRHRQSRFELHERDGSGWRFRAMFGDYADAERRAEELIRERKRPSGRGLRNS